MSNIGHKKSSKQPHNQPNEYEQLRRLRIQDNKTRMRDLGLKRISAELTSLVDSDKIKKGKMKQKVVVEEDEDYVPACCDDELYESSSSNDEFQNKERTSTKVKDCTKKCGPQKNQYIPPMAMAKFMGMNKKQQQAIVGEKALKALSSALKVVEQAMNSEKQLARDQEYIQFDEELESEDGEEQLNDNQENDGLETDLQRTENDAAADQAVGMQAGNEYLSGDLSNSLHGDTMLIGAEEQPVIRAKVKKTRGDVYCRKLTELAPGEKVELQFDRDGNAIGDNASIFAFFLGEQVRNRAVIPIQVSDWNKIQPDRLDFLWTCVLEKFSFDNPKLRREYILNHARRLFRDSRHKWKSQYFDTCQTKNERLKNKPLKMLQVDWKYLVDLWSTPEFQAKSQKARESRSFQKMPHYSGTQSYARAKQKFREQKGRDCSRVELLLETRKRKSKKPVNAEKLANNMQAVSAMEKLMKEREEGNNNKTDEQIFQEVLGPDTHGYLRIYGQGKSITDYYGVKPSRLDLAKEVMEIKKSSDEMVQKAQKDAEEAKKEAEQAKKDAERFQIEVNEKIEANNKMWEERLNDIVKIYGWTSRNSSD